MYELEFSLLTVVSQYPEKEHFYPGHNPLIRAMQVAVVIADHHRRALDVELSGALSLAEEIGDNMRAYEVCRQQPMPRLLLAVRAYLNSALVPFQACMKSSFISSADPGNPIDWRLSGGRLAMLLPIRSM